MTGKPEPKRRLPRAQDLTGNRYGTLVVLAQAESDPHRNSMWVCVCDCGKVVVKRRAYLLHGAPPISCGCQRSAPPRYKNIKGQRFGRLVALYVSDIDKNGVYVWRCQCDCGNTADVRGTELRLGRQKSCGCLRNELAATAHARRKQSKAGA